MAARRIVTELDALDDCLGGHGSELEDEIESSDDDDDSDDDPHFAADAEQVESSEDSADYEDSPPRRRVARVEEVVPVRGQGRGRAATRGRGAVRVRGAGRGRGRGRGVARIRGGGHGAGGDGVGDVPENGYPDDPSITPPVIPCDSEDFQVNLDLDWDTVTPLDIVMKLLPDNFFNLLKIETNRYARLRISLGLAEGPLRARSMLSQWKVVTLGELKAFFAIIIHMGLVKKPTLRDYWSTKSILNTNFAKTLMSRDRFLAISSMLHFNDSETYIPHGLDGYDALHKLRPFIDPLLTNFKNSVTLGINISLDEAMCAFRGRLRFRVYNANKPDKWGIKLFEVCDSSTGYAWRFEVYVGESGTTTDTVMRLLDDVLDKGHVVYMDRYYNSPTLTEKLLARNTQIVGTVKTNRRGLPGPLKTQKLKKGEIISFRKDRMMCLKWKDKREVSMISTIHNNSCSEVQRRGEGAPVMKPVCIMDYNNNMGGVDRSDQMMSYYPFKRKTLKWYKKLFYRLFYLTMLNSFMLYKQKTDRNSTLLKFLIGVGMGLAEQCSVSEEPVVANDTPGRLLGKHYVNFVPATESKQNASRRCFMCKKGDIRRETRYYCAKCNVALCVVGCFEEYHTKLNI